MNVVEFIENYKEAFGPNTALPIGFWYSDIPLNDKMEKINGCFFKEFAKLNSGESISLTLDKMGCLS